MMPMSKAKQAFLTQLKVSLHEILTESEMRMFRDTFQVQEAVHIFAEDVLYQFSAMIWREELPPVKLTKSSTTTFRAPANPWQHLKQRFAPGWFVRRFPVIECEEVRELTLTVDLERFRVFPKSNIPAGQGPSVAKFLVSEGIRWKDLPPGAPPVL